MAVILFGRAINGDKAAGGKLLVLKVCAADLLKPNGAGTDRIIPGAGVRRATWKIPDGDQG